MEEGIQVNEHQNLEGGEIAAIETHAETLPSTDFVKVEKNLASLGFFTPSSKRLRNAQEKSFTITTVADGQRMELKGTIIPSAKYGLPITADQDKWIALCKLLTDIIRKEGKVTNPVSFTSAEILRLLHKYRHSGKNYHEIEEWLDVLFSTTIFSEGVVYLAREKRRVKDRFRVFERAISFGKELPDGRVADKNYIWFSDWQLQNINSNHLLPIDLEAYRELKNHIAKALVPLLQIWLYATRKEGVFEKKYSELCEILNIRQYRYYSLIVQTLGPSLDELKQFGYLADWQIEKTSDNENYKVVFRHGEKFHRDRRARQSRKQIAVPSEPNQHLHSVPEVNREARPAHITAAASPTARYFDPVIVAEFTRLGITEDKARTLLANLKPGQEKIIQAQLEHAEYTVEQLKHSPNPVRNPAGFIISLIEKNTPVPDGFETKADRHAREERERKEAVECAAREAAQALEEEYEMYCQKLTNRYIEENPAAFEFLKEAKRTEERALRPTAWPSLIENFATTQAKLAMRNQLTLPTFEAFLEHKKQGTDFSLKLVAVPPAATPTEVVAGRADDSPQGDVVTEDVAELAVADLEIEQTIERAPAPDTEPQPDFGTVPSGEATGSPEAANDATATLPPEDAGTISAMEEPATETIAEPEKPRDDAEPLAPV